MRFFNARVMRGHGTTFPESVRRIRQGGLDRVGEAYETGNCQTR